MDHRFQGGEQLRPEGQNKRPIQGGGFKDPWIDATPIFTDRSEPWLHDRIRTRSEKAKKEEKRRGT